MRAQHRFGVIYRDLRELRKKVSDLEPALPPGVTARQLLHDLDDFEESLQELILRNFGPPSRCADTVHKHIS